jgi:hypothetical protein
MKAGYGEPLRRFFSEKAWVRAVVDFGHAKQIFEEADVFPSIIVVEKPRHATAAPPQSVRVCAIPREQLRLDDLYQQVFQKGFAIDRKSLTNASWRIEPPGLLRLLKKIEAIGKPLREFAGKKPLFGIKTGLNEAYLIDSATRLSLITEDRVCESMFKPYLRGQDIKRWTPDWNGLWIILLKSSGNHKWPWSGKSESAAEKIFQEAFPPVFKRVKKFEAQLRARSDKGTYWWELRSCGYYDVFEREKLMWQDIGYHSRFCLTNVGLVSEATCFALDTTDHWVLAVLNSPLIWCWLWRNTIHGKDEALRLKSLYTERIPIREIDNVQRRTVELMVCRLIQMSATQQKSRRGFIGWLLADFGIEKPSAKLQLPAELDADTLVSEVERVRGRKLPLTAAGEKRLREEHARTVVPARALAAEMLTLERTLSELVNQAYGLTPEEIALMWKTAPPRMPIPPQIS